MTKISIIGDGGWGTTLAILLAKRGAKVSLWGVFPEYIKFLNKKRENIKFLPGIKIPRNVQITDDLEIAFNKASLVVLAVPSQYLRQTIRKFKKYNILKFNFLSVIKGIEYKTTLRMSEVIQEELGNVKIAVLSGPNIAPEVVRGIPSACVCASSLKSLMNFVQNEFMTEKFRVYTNNDLIGVELGGALKNIIAIACGISDGLGFGSNTKAALLTRGLAEITRLGVAMGAKSKTFSGLSGMGDLVTTCLSTKSRNRSLGEELGKGKRLAYVLKRTEMVIEGVATTKSAVKLALRYGVDMPITQEVYRVLYKNKSPLQAVKDLMQRAKKKEM